MAEARLDAIGIVVGDLAQAVPFYRLLGAPFPEGSEVSEHGHAEAQLAGGVRLMLDSEEEIHKFDSEWRRATGSPGTSVAFRCSSPKDVDEVYAKAVAAGGKAHREPWDAFWGQRYAQIRDADGNAIDLYADLPR